MESSRLILSRMRAAYLVGVLLLLVPAAGRAQDRQDLDAPLPLDLARPTAPVPAAFQVGAVRLSPATVLALSVVFRRDAGVRIEDLPLDEPSNAWPLLERWARERPTVVVVSFADGKRPPETWGRLRAEVIGETRKPDGQPCDLVYRVSAPAP